MIPILYEANVTSFDSFGLGALTDVKSCVCTEERNGAFELTMEYPISGVHYEDLRHSRIILAKANQSQEPQGFRIYKITRPLNGIVTVYAEHLSYQLSYIPSGGFTANSVSNVFAGLKNNAYENCPFTFHTDNLTAGTYTQDLPRSIRSSLGGVDGSVLDVFGGEYEWDNFKVYNWENRGNDNGVTLRYGTNITDIKQEENIENTYTGVCPYWTSEESGTITLPEHVLHASTADNYPFKRTMMLDLTASFENAPSVAELRAAANAYMVVNNIGVPKVSIEVSFVQLSQTEEYKDIAPLETVGLCDYVHIYFEKLGVSATAKVVRTEYDTLLDRYNKIELGDAKSTFGDTIINAIQSTSDDKVSFTELDNAVQRATNLITGNSGGYVRFVYDADGFPEEIVIMDTDSIDTAQKVWRWNKSGLGYSSTGYDGTYALAMTQDGAIVADFITTGTLSANRVRAGQITSVNGTLVIDLDNDTITAKKLIVDSTYFKLDANGTTDISRATIGYAQIGTSTFSDCTVSDTLYVNNNGEINLKDVNYPLLYFKSSIDGLGTRGIEVHGAVDFISRCNFASVARFNSEVWMPYLPVAQSGHTANIYWANGQSNYGELYLLNSGSSKRYKHDITTELNEKLNPHNLYNLDVVQFKYNTDFIDDGEKLHIGFIAEDVEKVYPVATEYSEPDEDGNVTVENWLPREIIPAMLKLIQEQQEKINELEERLAKIEEENV